MATYLPTDSVTNSTSFIQQLDEARISIQQVFRDLMEKVQLREATLLKQLEDIKSDYELSCQETQETLNALKAQLDSTSQNLKLNQLIELQRQQVEQLNQRISVVEMEDGEERHISWSWDSQLIEAISAVGKLEVIPSVREQTPITVDYKQKVKPIISKCRDGSNDGDLKGPWGVAVDMNTGNIYITDSTDCVKVYTSNGDFHFKFGNDEKLVAPSNICIYKARLYLLHNHGVVIFDINGHLLRRFGTSGSDHNQFKFPCGIAISPLNSYIYICDCGNHRVQIYYSMKFKYKGTIGEGTLNYPWDIKFAQNELYILDYRNPCLHVYTTKHIYVRSFLSKGPGKQIGYSYCFHIDNNCNILITDYERHSICILTNRGELLHQIGGGESSDIYKPTGATIEKDGRIIVVNNKSTAKLLIY